MDKTAETLIDVSGFISEYSAHMMGCGVHTSRVIRSANRIGESFGYKSTDIYQSFGCLIHLNEVMFFFF
jgi:uncharacterized membrane protein YjjP (DUF1212 family)